MSQINKAINNTLDWLEECANQQDPYRAREAVKDIREAFDEASVDSERLSWLDDHGERELLTCEWRIHSIQDTLRDAIDTAMAEEERT